MMELLDKLEFLFRQHFAVFALPFLFVIGNCMGSFLNVCFYRIPIGMSVMHPPSSCPKCGYRIPAYENLPIIGWLMLRGRCRGCQVKIPVRYLLFEIFTGLIFCLTGWLIHRLGGGIQEVTFCLAAVSWFIPIIAIDARHKRIPRILTISGIIFFLIWAAALPFTYKDQWISDHTREFLAQALSKEFPDTVINDHWQSLLYATFGMVTGWAIILIASVITRMLCGRTHHQLESPTQITFDKDSFTLEGDEPASWEELLTERSDHMTFITSDGFLSLKDGSRIEIQGGPVKISRQGIHQDNNILAQRNDLNKGQLTCSKITLPNDVIGRGDITFLAMCGTVLGPLATPLILFCAVFSASFYALLTRFILRIKGRELPFGPFIALSALLLLLFPQHCRELSENLFELWQHLFS